MLFHPETVCCSNMSILELVLTVLLVRGAGRATATTVSVGW